MQVPSHGGSRYVLTFTDDFSRYTKVYFLHSKSDTLDKFKDYVKLMENATGNKIMKLSIKSLRSAVLNLHLTWRLTVKYSSC